MGKVASLIHPSRARQIMHAYKPRGWRIVMGGAQQRGATGLCDWSERTIYIPLVCCDYSLFVYLHEVGHVKLHRTSTKPSHIVEYEAEAWARAEMRKCGFRVSGEMLRAGKAYVADEIKKDRIKGLPIDEKVLRWATRRSRTIGGQS